MHSLQGKKIVVGISGSIAAYKSATLIRLLRKQGAEVQVVATEAALTFIPALTLATLSERPVLTDFVANAAEGTWNNHVKLGLWADVVLIAPLSAKTLAALANGYCHNLLVATYLSARCPVIVAPAMDLDMFVHPSTATNLEKLRNFGNHVIEPNEGPLASGLHGKGRMAEPEELLAYLHDFFAQRSDTTFDGKNALITVGPTQEFIDPVRYLSNGSSGKMGYALAEALLQRGAKVVLVSGPVQRTLTHPNLTLLPVRTAKEMLYATQQHHPHTDVAIFTAAVSDYAPQSVAPEKIKKNSDTLTLTLVKNPDIAKEMGQQKKPHQVHVGFALETENERAHALAKMHAKRFDMVVLNSLRDAGAGFGHDTNKITLLYGTQQVEFPLKPKADVAHDILSHLSILLNNKIT